MPCGAPIRELSPEMQILARLERISPDHVGVLADIARDILAERANGKGVK